MSAIRAPPTVSWAASSIGSSSGLRNASRKTASIRVCVALPPGAVRHRDAFFPHLGAAPPRAVDPVQHLLFPAGFIRVGQRQLAPPFGGETLVLGKGLVDPAPAHERTTPASATRVRFIRPKL